MGVSGLGRFAGGSGGGGGGLLRFLLEFPDGLCGTIVRLFFLGGGPGGGGGGAVLFIRRRLRIVDLKR